MTTYGYIRISTKGQNEARQEIALEKYGVDRQHIFLDKQSGKNFERPEYQKMLRLMSPGDSLIIKSIDRLGRNYSEVLEQWRFITQHKKISIVVLDMPILDTRHYRDLIGRLISDIILEVLSCVAEMEHAFNKQRQAEGIQVAKDKRVRFGRKPMRRPPEFAALHLDFNAGNISARKAAKILGITHRTFLRWVKDKTGEQPMV